MALVPCKECGRQVGTTALVCPHCGTRLRKPRRGLFGKLALLGFWGFNLVMGLWLMSYWGRVAEMHATAGSRIGQSGVEIGATMGTGVIAFFWLAGAVVLGLFVMFSRPKA